MPDDKKPENKVNPADEIAALKAKLAEEESIRKSVMSNPIMVQALEAVKEGKMIKIVGDETKEEPVKKASLKDRFGNSADEPIKPEKLNDMAMSEALDVFADVVEDYVDSRLKETVDTFSKPLDDRFKQIGMGQEKLAQAILEQAKRTGSTMMKSQHTDFDKYQDEAYKAVEQFGMTLEDAYTFVKAKNSDKIPPRQDLDSERPSITPSRSGFPSSRDARKEEVHTIARSSSRRLRDVTRDAVDRVFSKRNSQ